ncbi:MAG: hypothetical protein JNL07_06950, partial [Rhodospirillales bacterium]|nr:hypothetical protein [Rhodospirillales bacterium]
MAAAIGIAASAVGGGVAAQEASEGQFMVRLRALYMVPANNSTAIPALGVPKDKLSVNDR